MRNKKKTLFKKVITETETETETETVRIINYSNAAKKRLALARNCKTFDCKHGCGAIVTSPRKSVPLIRCAVCKGPHEILIK